MSAHLKLVQPCRRTRRGVCFYEGFLCIWQALEQEQLALQVLSITAVVSSSVIQVTKVFPFCGVMLGVHCITSAAVYSHALQGQVGWPRRVSYHGSNMVHNTRSGEQIQVVALVLATSQGSLHVDYARYPIN